VTTKSVIEKNNFTVETFNGPTTSIKPLTISTISTIKLIDLIKITTNSVTQKTVSTQKSPLVINVTSSTKLINYFTSVTNITDKSNIPTAFDQPSTSSNTIISSNIHDIKNIHEINKNNPDNSTKLVLNIAYTSTVAPKTIAVNNSKYLLSSNSINLKYKNILTHSTLPINSHYLPIITTENTNTNLKFDKIIKKTELNYNLYDEQKKHADDRLENPGNQSGMFL
jgi:hypothetical protein